MHSPRYSRTPIALLSFPAFFPRRKVGARVETRLPPADKLASPLTPIRTWNKSSVNFVVDRWRVCFKGWGRFDLRIVTVRDIWNLLMKSSHWLRSVFRFSRTKAKNYSRISTWIPIQKFHPATRTDPEPVSYPKNNRNASNKRTTHLVKRCFLCVYLVLRRCTVDVSLTFSRHPTLPGQDNRRLRKGELRNRRGSRRIGALSLRWRSSPFVIVDRARSRWNSKWRRSRDIAVFIQIRSQYLNRSAYRSQPPNILRHVPPSYCPTAVASRWTSTVSISIPAYAALCRRIPDGKLRSNEPSFNNTKVPGTR